MLMPSIFGEELFEDLFDLPFYDDSKVEKKLYGRQKSKTYVKEEAGKNKGKEKTYL